MSESGAASGPHSLKTMLRCGDFDATRRFYQDVLGLDVIEEWDDPGDRGCIFRVGPEGGFLELLHDGASGSSEEAPSPGEVPGSKVELQIHVASVDAWVDRLRGHGAIEGPVTRPWGNRYLWVRDPEGIRVALFQGPAE